MSTALREPDAATVKRSPDKEAATVLRHRRRVKRIDRFAKTAISASGFLIIAAILGIGVFLFIQILPLFSGASLEPRAAFAQHDNTASAQFLRIDERQAKGMAVGRLPQVTVVALDDGSVSAALPLVGIEGSEVLSASYYPDKPSAAFGTAGGKVWVGDVDFTIEYEGSLRVTKPRVEQSAVIDFSPEQPVLFVTHRWGSDGGTVVAVSAQQVQVAQVAIRRPLIGAPTKSVRTFTVPVEAQPIRSIALNGDGGQLMVGTAGGELQRWRIASAENVALIESARVGETAVTVLQYLMGSRSLISGTAAGAVDVWFLVNAEDGADGRKLIRAHQLQPMDGGVARVVPSARDKSFFVVSEKGLARLYHMTTRRILLQKRFDVPLTQVAMAPKADGIWTLDAEGRSATYNLKNPHPDVSLGVFFTPTRYEGYPEPEHVWQSHGATDDFEPKFGLVPLIFGTLKGTFYAMLFSVPIAVFAGLYVSQFLDSRLKNPVKSTIELMAALPSVVLGFIAGLVLAPFAQDNLIAVLVLPIIVPVAVLAGMACSQLIPSAKVRRLVRGNEFWILVAWVAFGIWASFELGPVLEKVWFRGDVQAWLFETFGIRYDQRNALVVGWAMGFAVIPIIFTICEDAFSSVPKHLVAASLACGASQWQTAARVVLPAAGSAVFSAVMIGLGRSIGETMIVLMATGNTAIMDILPFNGFRALSANIAVEIPEAPLGSTHYRVLFVTALILFAMTFVLNTVAELVRLRLRRNLEGI